MKRVLVFITILFVAILSSCNLEQEEQVPKEEDTCTIGFNETFDMCALPVKSNDSFNDVVINIDDQYNVFGDKMISNVLYNYFTETLEFDLQYKSDVFIENVNVTVIDGDTYNEIINDTVLFDLDYIDRDNVQVSIDEHIFLKGIAPGETYIVKVTYDYHEGGQYVPAPTKGTRPISTFEIDTTMYDNVDVPELVQYEMLSNTTDSIEISFEMSHQDIEIDRLEVRIFDPITGEYTGVSKQIENIDQYREGQSIYVPSIIIEGLKSNVYYDIKIYGSGTYNADEYSNIALIDDELLHNQQTDKHFYERDSLHFFHFDLIVLYQNDNGVSLFYEFFDERDTYLELRAHESPVYLMIKNANGYDVLEVELDTGLTEYVIPQSIFDQADIIAIYYKNSYTKQYLTLAIWGVNSIPVE